MADERELRAAVELVAKINRGEWHPGQPPTSQEHWDAVCLLAEEYVQQLTTPQDVEAELRAVVVSICEFFVRDWNEEVAERVAGIIRPLLRGRADVANITVCWLPYQSYPFVHGSRHGKDVWLTRDGSWTEDEGSEACKLDATPELRESRGRADDGEGKQ